MPNYRVHFGGVDRVLTADCPAAAALAVYRSGFTWWRVLSGPVLGREFTVTELLDGLEAAPAGVDWLKTRRLDPRDVKEAAALLDYADCSSPRLWAPLYALAYALADGKVREPGEC